MRFQVISFDGKIRKSTNFYIFQACPDPNNLIFQHPNGHILQDGMNNLEHFRTLPPNTTDSP